MSIWSDIGSNIGSHVASAVTGKAQKAILCIPKISESTGSDNLLGDTLGKIKSAVTKIQSISGSSNWWDSNENVARELGNDFHVMQVQYNPSTISMNAIAGSYAYDYRMGPGDKGGSQTTLVENNNVPAQINMSVELMFDDMNANDCFRGVTVRELASSILKDHSVQTQVEGLIALTTRKATRKVIFHWADMTFVGEILNVQAKYTMFSIKGDPVRASVRLTMSDTSADMDNDRSSNMSDDYWQKAFDNAFGEQGISTSLKIGSSVSNNRTGLNF